MMKVLHLTLKKKWFDMIASGEKKEEYRELKDYWGARLCFKVKVPWGGHLTKWTKLKEGDRGCLNDDFIPNFEKFDYIQFRDGCNRQARVINLQCIGIEIKTGKSEWGAEPSKEYFVIKLGDKMI